MFNLQKEAIYPSNLRITSLAYCFQHSFQNISKKHHKSCQSVKWTIDSECIAKAKNFIKPIMTSEAMAENKCTFSHPHRALRKPTSTTMAFHECQSLNSRLENCTLKVFLVKLVK